MLIFIILKDEKNKKSNMSRFHQHPIPQHQFHHFPLQSFAYPPPRYIIPQYSYPPPPQFYYPTYSTPIVEERNACPISRPTICQQDYRPVCGIVDGNSFKTFSNSCAACADTQVDYWTNGQCR